MKKIYIWCFLWEKGWFSWIGVDNQQLMTLKSWIGLGLVGLWYSIPIASTIMLIDSSQIITLMVEFSRLTPSERKIYIALLNNQKIPRLSTRTVDSFVAKIKGCKVLNKAIGLKNRKDLLTPLGVNPSKKRTKRLRHTNDTSKSQVVDYQGLAQE